MKEAIGQVFSLEFIIIFLLLLNGYLAFNVNYSKAFRVKNEIRSIIQKNEGLTDSAVADINSYMQSVNYYQGEGYNKWCSDNHHHVCRTDKGAFCYDVTTSDKYGTDEAGNEIAAYYTIYTFVDINIPVLNRFIPQTAGLFKVMGETSLIYTKETPYIGEDLRVNGCK